MRKSVAKAVAQPLYKPELRLYTFMNFYLSSIQQGIQSAHINNAMGVFYGKVNKSKQPYHLEAKGLYDTWAGSHQTIIVLNGGTFDMLVTDYTTLLNDQVNKKYPMGKFNEEPGAIDRDGQVMTGWGIVLPDSVFNAKPEYVGRSPARRTGAYESGVIGVNYAYWDVGSIESMICSMLESKHLAR